jgi:hypothetical protein
VVVLPTLVRVWHVHYGSSYAEIFTAVFVFARHMHVRVEEEAGSAEVGGFRSKGPEHNMKAIAHSGRGPLFFRSLHTPAIVL